MAVDNGIFLIGIAVIVTYLFLWRPKKTRLWGAIFLLAIGVGGLYIGTTTQEDFTGFIIMGIGLVSIVREMLEIF